MSVFTTDYLNSEILRLVIDHVFMPPKLPQIHPGRRKERKMNVALCNSLMEAAQDFVQFLSPSEGPLCMQMIKMIDLVRRAAKVPFNQVGLQRVLSDMGIGGTYRQFCALFRLWLKRSSLDVFCIHIRAQNAAIIVRRLATADAVQIEVFEVSPLESAVMKTEGKLRCSYPGPAIQIPADIFMDECFLRELSSFLVQMDVDHLPPLPVTNSTQQSDLESDLEIDPQSSLENDHGCAHPGYISELLVGILRGYGLPAVVDRITKRIGDDVLLLQESWEEEWPERLRRWLLRQDKKQQRTRKPWRRSPLWLILRVSLQTSLSSTNIYKLFILFFHAHLLRICVRRDFSSELLYVMRAKMARRLAKLGPHISRDISQVVHDAANETEALLSKRWTAFQAVESTDLTSMFKMFNALDFIADAHTSLNQSYKYLRKALGTTSHNSSQSQFTPSRESRLCDVYDFTRFANGGLSMALAVDPRVVIADFELSVERNLETWAAAYRSDDGASEVIASCIQQYHTGATNIYKANPEDNSVMILTIMDLWVALDRITIHQCPLLKEYSPEIPSNFLHSILLHRSSGLKRALHIEEYLTGRHEEALGITSVFSNSFDDSCFAMKYFHTSEDLQHLNDRIITRIRRAPVTKRAKRGKSLHEKLKSSLRYASETGINLIDDPALEQSLLLDVPTQLVAFELSPPQAFSAWRDITYMILCDIGLPSVTDSESQDKSALFLDAFPILQSLVAKRQEYPRVTVAFSDQIDRNTIGNPVKDTLGFLDTGRSFGLFDRLRKSCAMASFFGSRSAKLCAPPIPESSPYRHLHHFVCGTQHAPNSIIAAQADCPDEMNLLEFLAFSGLRCGPRLQWLNIARELASPFLSFNREEVHTLITQAAWQLGPLSNGDREWHVDLGISNFGGALLRELCPLLRVIQANWQEEVTVRTIGTLGSLSPHSGLICLQALICSRLLTSTSDPDIALQACALLREARTVTYQWIGEISKQLNSTEGETSRASIRRRLCMLAVTCFSTFDVCPDHVPATLSSKEDFSVAMQCAVIVHDNASVDVSLPNGGNSRLREASMTLEQIYHNRMLHRHYRLLHRLEPIFSQSISPVRGRAELLHGDAYDVALSRLWAGYRRGNTSSWHALSIPNSRWIYCVTQRGQKVHYDLLTGKLLINGKRLGGLLQEIVANSTYISVFRGVSYPRQCFPAFRTFPEVFLENY